ncbi:MAG: flagellar basal body-associated protein FliL [Candidatus Latescibacterota bacterium]|jgi:flagellar basal body-associated protein FliL
MADEDMMEMDELGEDEEEDSAGGGNPLLKYLPMIGIVLVVQIVIVYFAVQWFTPDMPDEADSAETAEQAPIVVEEAASDAGGGEGGFEPPPTTVLTIFEKLDIIVVNPAGTDGLRFMSVQVALGLSDVKVEEYITKNNMVPRIYDRLVSILSSKTITDVDPSRHPQLKDEIRKRLNQILGENAVLEVYFQSFVLQ